MWIHLWALTAAIYVIVPRLVLISLQYFKLFFIKNNIEVDLKETNWDDIALDDDDWNLTLLANQFAKCGLYLADLSSFQFESGDRESCNSEELVTVTNQVVDYHNQLIKDVEYFTNKDLKKYYLNDIDIDKNQENADKNSVVEDIVYTTLGVLILPLWPFLKEKDDLSGLSHKEIFSLIIKILPIQLLLLDRKDSYFKIEKDEKFLKYIYKNHFDDFSTLVRDTRKEDINDDIIKDFIELCISISANLVDKFDTNSEELEEAFAKLINHFQIGID